jgi:type VI protein secretion system component Hcp
MLSKSILPKVEINTPNGIVTLVNAQIVNIKPYVPHATPERSMPPSGFVAGVYAVKDGTVPKRRNPHELEEFDLVFNKITYTNVLGGKAAQDSWNIPG